MEAGLPEPGKGPAVGAVTTLGSRNDVTGSLVSWSQAGGAWASGEAGSPGNSTAKRKWRGHARLLSSYPASFATVYHLWNPSWTGCPGNLVPRDQPPRDGSGR